MRAACAALTASTSTLRPRVSGEGSYEPAIGSVEYRVAGSRYVVSAVSEGVDAGQSSRSHSAFSPLTSARAAAFDASNGALDT